MSLSLQQLLEQRDQLEAAIATERTRMRDSGLETIRETIARLGLTQDDVMRLFPKPAASRSTSEGERGSHLRGRKVPPKYHDPATGHSWSGRGIKPNWLRAFEEKGGSLDSLRTQTSVGTA
jgi:DNA-binding protein H-NS